MTQIVKTDLSEKMHALANSDHPRANELREKADAFDAATHGFMVVQPPTHTVKQQLGTWARASRLFDECRTLALPQAQNNTERKTNDL